MPEHELTPRSGSDFTRALLRDVLALERMLEEGLLEVGVRRVGAEQELVLVDRHCRPSPVAMAVLEDLDDPRFSTELARFNLEINLPPLVAGPRLLSMLHARLTELLSRVEAAAGIHGAEVALTGILPCLSQRDLTLESMTPKDRYRRLNEATMKLAGGPLRLHIGGTDELRVEHDSMMLEACNTSFQVHLQVEAAEFAAIYNAAQLVLAPVLAAATNSPFLFGKRLWAETRIAVFRQTVDTRADSPSLRDVIPRVRFGSAWVRESVVELFTEDVVRFRPLVTAGSNEDPLAVLDAGGVPRLESLQLHNSTVYRWNRPCYGISDGRPHLRIECRALPAGPTLVDEVANAAFWLGLIASPAAFGDIASRLPFQDARANFFTAARRGLDTTFTWLDGERLQAARLILERLLPLAGEGLVSLGVSASEADRYLDVIGARVRSDQTGARWLERSAAAMAGTATRPERCVALTSAMIRRQGTGRPVHEWELARFEEGIGAAGPTVDQYMNTSLITVRADEAVDLAAFMMDRQHTRQVLVEDEAFRLVGVIHYRSLLRRLLEEGDRDPGRPVPVRELMDADPPTVAPDTRVLEAIRVMAEQGTTSLTVVHEGKLVGILSERDLLPIAAELLQREMRAREP